MRRRILIVLAALVLAGLSASAVLVYARGVDSRAVSAREGVWVLLAAESVPAGTTGAQLRQRDLAKRVLMPASTVPDGALTGYDTTLDALRLNTDLAPQQIVMRGLFTVSGNSAQVGVPEGELAVSVAVSMAPGVAEKVASGDQVTVFVTYPADAPPSKQTTRVLLPAATVVSIDSGPPAAGATATPGTAARLTGSGSSRAYPATLAVGQQDATRLVHAAQTGEIYLGLVGVNTTISPAPGVSYGNMWGKP